MKLTDEERTLALRERLWEEKRAGFHPAEFNPDEYEISDFHDLGLSNMWDDMEDGLTPKQLKRREKQIRKNFEAFERERATYTK